MKFGAFCKDEYENCFFNKTNLIFGQILDFLS